MQLPFVKMHGLGNDFIIIDERMVEYHLSEQQIRLITDRHRGVGCDQLIILRPSHRADFTMLIINQDGSQAGACGNATRCVADLIMKEKNIKYLAIETLAGVLIARLTENGQVMVDMGKASLDWQIIPLSKQMDPLNVDIVIAGLSVPAAVSMGNPHLVFFSKNLASVNLASIGPELEHHPFFPNRVNVNIAEIIDRSHLALRVFERGVGETSACGSGACASFYIAYLKNLLDSKAVVSLPGGELQIQLGKDKHILMTGPSTLSFTGIYYI